MTKLSTTQRLTGGAGLCALVWAGACSLDLDEGLIDSTAGGGGDASASGGLGGSTASGGTAGTARGGTGASAAGGSGGGSGGVAAGGSSGSQSGGAGGSAGAGATGGGGTGGTGATGTCQDASECTSTNSCLVPICQSGRCIFESCPPTADMCEARACSPQNDTCQSSTGYGFNAHQFQLSDSIGCSGNAERCLAAMGSLLFIGTSGGGVQAFDMSDPTAPRTIALQQPPFAITRLIETEGRILIEGPISAGKLSLAWVDEPTSPLVDSLPSTAVAVNFDDSISAGYPADPGAFQLVRNSAASFYPALRVAPPITNGATFTLFGSAGIPLNANVVAASGSRLITFRVDTTSGQNEPYFSLETSAGTTMAQNAGERNLFGETGEVPNSTSAHRFSSTRSGALLWSTNQLVRPDGGSLTTSATILRWPLLDRDDATMLGTRMVMLESNYTSVSSNSALSGPAAQIGETHALATAADSGNTAQTAVHGIVRTGDTLAPAPGTNRFVIPFSTGQIGVAGGTRYGYVLAPTSTTEPVVTTVYVFAPGC